MSARRPTLSACILAHSSRAGLGRLLRELDGVVDQVVVGVDSASTDDTFALACRHADVVFRFEHVGPPVRARLLPLRRATGDWILEIDEDEGLDDAFEPLLHELLADPRYTHYWLPRRWIVEREPLTYLHAAPWFPDWQLRLFRNDPGRVWHNGTVHSGYRVMGPGCWEDRSAVLHYETVVLTSEERERKVDFYRRHGSDGRSESYYRAPGNAERREVTPGPAPSTGERPRERRGRVIPGIEPVPGVPTVPPWGAALKARMPSTAQCGAPVLVEILARNTGRLAWDTSGPGWPILHLSYHLTGEDGAGGLEEGERFRLPRVVEPGGETRCHLTVRAPEKPGRYRFEWDLVSEGECWFADCGSRPAGVSMSVTPAHPR